MQHAVRSGLTLALAVASPVAAQQVLPVEGPVRFAFYDVAGTGGPQLVLAVRSDRDYPTTGYLYDVVTTIDGDVITADLRRITNNGNVELMTAPAWYSTPVALPTGTYEIRIRNGRRVDKYVVRVGTAVIDVSGGAGSFTIPPRRVYRMPPRAVYLSCQPAGNPAALCDDFLAALEARTGGETAPDLAVRERNPFARPFPERLGPDDGARIFFRNLSDDQLSQALAMVSEFTGSPRQSRNTPAVHVFRANGPGYSCYAGVCHPHQ